MLQWTSFALELHPELKQLVSLKCLQWMENVVVHKWCKASWRRLIQSKIYFARLRYLSTKVAIAIWKHKNKQVLLIFPSSLCSSFLPDSKCPWKLCHDRKQLYVWKQGDFQVPCASYCVSLWQTLIQQRILNFAEKKKVLLFVAPQL